MVKVVSLFYLKNKKIYVAPDLTVCFSQVFVLLPKIASHLNPPDKFACV